MPRPKGWKKPVEVERSHCAVCGQALPAAAMRVIWLFLEQLEKDLHLNPAEGADASEQRRFFHLAIAKARAVVSVFREQEKHTCKGHQPIKRGPRKKAEGNPSFPADADVPGPRKKRGRPPTLAAVPNE